MNKIEKTKKILINATLATVSIGVSLLVIDRLVPVLLSVPPHKIIHRTVIDITGYGSNYHDHVRCLSVLCPDDNEQYLLRTGEHGFILGAKQAGDNAAQGIDILFLGGSTTETILVDEDKRFPYRVSQLLQNSDNQNIKTLNGGVGGYTSMHSIFNLLGKGLPTQPKFVIMMHALNDTSVLIKAQNHRYHGIRHNSDNSLIKIIINPSFITTVLKDVKNSLIPNIYSRFIYPNLKTYQAKRITAANSNSPRQQQLSNKTAHESLVSFAQSLQLFIAVCRIYGIEPVLMTQANRLTRDDEVILKDYEKNRTNPLSALSYAALYHQMNQVTRAVAHEANILLIDLDRELSSRSEYMYDAVHLNNEGSTAAAHIIAQELATAFPDMFRLPQS